MYQGCSVFVLEDKVVVGTILELESVLHHTKNIMSLVRELATPMLLLSIFACSEPAVVPADANSQVLDASVAESGVLFSFRATNLFPDNFDTNGYDINVRQSTVTIQDLRLIGDSATGDTRTQKDLVDLHWDSDTVDSTGKIVSVVFPDAPSGIYSRGRGTLSHIFMSGDVSFPMGGNYTYIIDQSVSIPIDFDLDFALEAETRVELPIKVKLKQMSDAIWKGEVVLLDDKVTVEIPDTEEVSEAIEDSFDDDD